MNILLLAPTYLDLYKPIKEELENQGHNVTFCIDYLLEYHCRWTLKKMWKIIYLTKDIRKIYWKHFFRKDKEKIFEQKYDHLICIDGTSFHPILIKKMKKNNPQMTSTLYVWDTNKYYDFFWKAPYFDNVLTFDLEDSLEFKVSFLPFYWVPYKTEETERKYSLSIVGSEHDERLRIVEDVAVQLDKHHINYCFKIFTKKQSRFAIETFLPIKDTLQIMSESKCILDTDRPTQTGTTPRVIWALAMGKKIISTNTNLKKMPFYSPNQILIINREKPIIDIEFLNSKNTDNKINDNYIQNLRIDSWVLNLL